MALLDKGLKQRMVGALVLIALAVIFVPMLFTRQNDLRHVSVDAPAMPATPSISKVEMEPIAVPEPASIPEGLEIAEETVDEASAAPTPQATPEERPTVATQSDAVQSAPQEQARLDANKLPVSWSIQLASLSNRASAETLQKTLRSQGYNAYIRVADGMNRVFVGPLIERDEANRLRDQLQRQQKLNGFVVRFKPEAL
ncbi:SPOR domain-containing protein [Stutzerimonas stutzeri]|uniref:SPOR domain-containing protein n=1 Tax=Stutzerimonas sp. S1 TaxID=3030652 RepID=UPI002224DCE9|nr:SPOR domain-containing protein [Stutzerimonas sp. S1]MCW3148863.1 SPOR domain-containing protein [Stutzerimonas sp. S1]